MGIVEPLGSDVSRVQPDQRVCFCNRGLGAQLGSHVEFAVVPETQLVKVPDSVDDASAAALPLVFTAAWESLYECAQIRDGKTVLIHAGAEGVPGTSPCKWRLRSAGGLRPRLAAR